MHRLSNEILEQLLSFLDCADIESCRHTCRRFRDVIQGSVLLRYLYRLRISARVDGDLHTSKLSMAHRLHALQDQESAWLRADFTPVATLKLPDDLALIMSTYGSLYALTKRDGEHECAFGKVMRISEVCLGNPDARWQELDLTTPTPSRGTDTKIARELVILGECNLLVVFSV